MKTIRVVFEWFRHNMWSKIGAFLLALALWFYVAGEEKTEVELKVPVQFELAEKMVILSQGPGYVRVIVRGRKDDIAKLIEKDIFCKFDLTKYNEPQTIIMPVEKQNIPIKQDIEILKTAPARLTVKIDKLEQRILPVKIIVAGELAPGCKIEGFEVNPISAVVKGPKSVLEKMEFINTEPVDVTGRQKSFKKMVALDKIPIIGQEVPPQFVEIVLRIGTGKGKVKK